MDTKNWQDKVQKILETTVSCSQCSQTTCILISKWQVEKYYMMWPGAEPTISAGQSELCCMNTESPTTGWGELILTKFDWFHLGCVTWDNEGWASELWCYLKELPADVTKEMDIVEWWQVCLFFLNCTVLNILTPRIMLNSILHLPELPSTFFHVKHCQCLASGFSLQVSRQLMIDGHHWVPSGLRSYR